MPLASHLLAAIDVTAPILFILGLGVYFRKTHFLSPDFIGVGNRLVFNVTLPCLLFIGTATRPIKETLNLPLVVFAALSIIVIVGVLLAITPMFIDKDRRGVFIQNAFRGNMGIVGLALCLNAYGQEGLAAASVYLAFMTILYNTLAVLLLSPDKSKFLYYMVTNPLLIGVSLGLIWSVSGLELPVVIEQSGRYFAQMTLPLALLCIGASLNISSLRQNRKDVGWAAAWKLLIIPFSITPLAHWYGFQGQDLGILFLMMATPTAAAAFVMARQLTPYGVLAAESIALTSALSPITVTMGLVVFSFLGWM